MHINRPNVHHEVLTTLDVCSCPDQLPTNAADVCLRTNFPDTTIFSFQQERPNGPLIYGAYNNDPAVQQTNNPYGYTRNINFNFIELYKNRT